MNKLLVEFTASFLIWFLYLGIAVLWVIDGRIKKEQALHALFASGASWIIVTMIKDLVDTQRPYLVNNLPTNVFITPNDGAFPSSHTAAAFALAVAVWLHNKKIGMVFLIAALAIGIARVVGNVHYPIDVVGGAVIGSLTALAVERIHLFKLIKHSNT